MHVIKRGHNRGHCFVDARDCELYLACLRELASKHRCRLHAYCLMPNHIHLFLTPDDPQACESLMRPLGQRYAQYFNRRHRRTGSVWEGRFRSCIVDTARYVLACYRYIEMNPVEAALAASPSGYEWSSFNANSGVRTDPALAPHAEYLALGAEPRSRAAAYTGLFKQPLDAAMVDAIRKATQAGDPLGLELGDGARAPSPVKG